MASRDIAISGVTMTCNYVPTINGWSDGTGIIIPTSTERLLPFDHTSTRQLHDPGIILAMISGDIAVLRTTPSRNYVPTIAGRSNGTGFITPTSTE